MGETNPIFGNPHIVRWEFYFAEPWVCLAAAACFQRGTDWGLVAELLVVDFGIKKSGRKVVLFEICVLICTLFVAFFLYIYKAYIYMYDCICIFACIFNMHGIYATGWCLFSLPRSRYDRWNDEPSFGLNQHMGVSKNRETAPKMDGFLWNTRFRIDDLGVPYFWKHPYIHTHHSQFWKIVVPSRNLGEFWGSRNSCSFSH